MKNQPGVIIALTHDARHPLFTSWLPEAPLPVDGDADAGSRYNCPAETALVVAVDTYHEPSVSLLCKAVEQGTFRH